MKNPPKKSLGQNFLTSVGAIQKIIASSDYSPDLTALEVGPGKGVLTEALLKKFDKVVAVERDHELIEFLQNKFSKEIDSGQFRLIEGDILKLDPKNLGLSEKKLALPAHGHEGNSRPKPVSSPINYAIIANIPYYITGQFLRTWLPATPQPKYMVLMVQKEVAERIVARDGKESLLSNSVKIYGQPQYIETVKRGSFYPIPKVDSAILKIANISNPFLPHLEAKLPSPEKIFFNLLKAGFTHKRKLLLSNLFGDPTSKKFWRLDLQKALQEAFATCGINPRARAENLTVGDWKCLSTKAADFMAEK